MPSAPLFQHRHYRKIAEIIAAIPDRDLRGAIAENFAIALRHTNPDFKRERFMAAALGNPSNGRDGHRHSNVNRWQNPVGNEQDE